MTDMEHNEGLEPIAIIGMACRFPGAPNIDRFWQNLLNGVESVRFFSENELRAAGIPAENYRKPNYVPAHAVLEDSDCFDEAFFGFSKREAELMDPQHRIFLECAWNTIEHAGYNADKIGERCGVVAGVGLNMYMLNNLLKRQDLTTPENFYSLFIGNDKDFLPTRVSYKLNLHGPSLNINTACSSGLVAVHTACQQLLSYQADTVLAGAASIQVPQINGYEYQPGGIPSPDGHCRAFDRDANGTIVGSGVGVVMLKRVDDALRDGDTVHAVILSTAINNDGSQKAGFTAPGVEGQASVISEAQALAGVTPDSISYIEAHGTGTPLGDPIEVSALKQAFGNTSKKQFCRIGSVKTNIGHLDTAAGIAGLIKTALSLKHGMIPASLNYQVPNPRIDFTNSPFQVCSELSPWSTDGPRRAGVSSFGIGGTNAHAVLQEAPTQAVRITRAGKWLIPLSATTEAARQRIIDELGQYLANKQNLHLNDVAKTLSIGRKTFSEAAFVVAANTSELKKALQIGKLYSGRRPETRARVAFLFPGQGAQTVGAGKMLYQNNRVFRKAMDLVAGKLLTIGGNDVRELLFCELSDKAETELRRTVNAQAVIFAFSYAMTQLWKHWGIEADAVLGHSSGEYAAAVCAGLMTLDDAAALVFERGRLMERLPDGAMTAVALSGDELRKRLPANLWIAAINSPDQCTVAGSKQAVNKLETQLEKEGVFYKRLRTAHAFHTPAVDPVLPSFRKVLDGTTLQTPQKPFYSAVLGCHAETERITDRELWSIQMREPVRFGDAYQSMVDDGFTVFIEMGPGSTLTGLAGMADRPADLVLPGPDVADPGVADEEQTMLENLGKLWLYGAEPSWDNLIDEQAQRIPLPVYPFERTRHWLDPLVSSTVQEQHPVTQTLQKIDDWFYVPSWKRSAPLRAKPDIPINGDWLVFNDQDSALCEQLKQTAASIIKVQTGSKYSYANRIFTVNPASSDDYVQMFEELQELGFKPSRVLHTWSLYNLNGDDRDLGFNSLLYLAQAIAKYEIFIERIDIVTTHLFDVSGEDELNPQNATLISPTLVIPAEFPALICRCIDIQLSDPQHTENLIRELSLATDDALVAWRGRSRWLPFFERIQLPAIGDKTPFRTNGNYLITGGLGGMGLLLAEYLAGKSNANLILSSRQKLPDESTWEELVSSNAGSIKVSLSELSEFVSQAEKNIEHSCSIRRLSQRPGLLEAGNTLAASLAIDFLQQKGILLRKDQELNRIDIYKACEVLPEFERLLDHLLIVLENDKWLALNGEQVKVLRDSSDVAAPADLITEITAAHPGMAAQFELLDTCFKDYGDALSGRIPAISVLYPEGGRGRMAAAADRTEEHTNHRVYHDLLAEILAELAARANRPLRILEVGGGNGIMTGKLVERLKDFPIQYTFTDIGVTFVRSAEKQARERNYDFMHFATFDITSDPLSQGFSPASYDAVIGLDVIHATPSIRHTLSNLETLLADGGIFCLVESARTFRWNDMIWGLAEGWWYFEDTEIRLPNSPLLSTQSWEKLMLDQGYSAVVTYPQEEKDRKETDCSLIMAQKCPPSDNDSNDKDINVIQRLLAIREQAAGLMVVQADVADAEQMTAALATAEAGFGKIHGVIHAAAIESKAVIASGSKQVDNMEFRPKIDGTLVLHELFHQYPLDFMLLCSSISAVQGGAGQIGYCAANAFLDAFAELRSRACCGITVSVNWGRWQGVGLAQDFESWHKSQTGKHLLGGFTAEEGCEALARILSYNPGPRVAVMSSEWRPDQHFSGTPSRGNDVVSVVLQPQTETVAKLDFDGSVTERRLADIWQQILGSSKFDRESSFQDLGGDSLVGIQMISRIRESFGIQLPIHAVFDCPTIARLAAFIETTMGGEEEIEEGEL